MFFLLGMRLEIQTRPSSAVISHLLCCERISFYTSPKISLVLLFYNACALAVSISPSKLPPFPAPKTPLSFLLLQLWRHHALLQNQVSCTFLTRSDLGFCFFSRFWPKGGIFFVFELGFFGFDVLCFCIWDSFFFFLFRLFLHCFIR